MLDELVQYRGLVETVDVTPDYGPLVYPLDGKLLYLKGSRIWIRSLPPQGPTSA